MGMHPGIDRFGLHNALQRGFRRNTLAARGESASSVK